MGKFDANYRARMTIKGQTLVNFIAEFTYSDTTEVAGTVGSAEVAKGVKIGKSRMSTTDHGDNSDNTEQWTLYVDRASNDNILGVGMMLISPKGHKIHWALHFRF